MFNVQCRYRRIIIVGTLPLMSTQTTKRAVLGMLLSLVSLALYREMQPFNRKSTNLVAYVAQYAVLITFGSALVLEVEIFQGLNSWALGSLLCIVNLVIITMVLRMSLVRYFSDRAFSRASKMKSANGKVEWAVGFSEGKLKTTFDAVTEHYVSSSQGLVFTYCSCSSATMALREGIPALLYDEHELEGILFSLHRPYELDSTDRQMFSSFEVVLACSVPLTLLSRLALPSQASLRLLPGSVLKALRGSYFGDVVDPTGWFDGFVYLPPNQIVRALQLIENETPSLTQDDAESKQPTVLRDVHHQVFDHRNSARSSAAPSMYPRNSKLNSIWRDRRSTAAAPHRSTHGSSIISETESFSMTNAFSMSHFADVRPWSSFLQVPQCCSELFTSMESVRAQSDLQGWNLVFHYTQPFLGPLIYTTGFRMSTTGQGILWTTMTFSAMCTYVLLLFILF